MSERSTTAPCKIRRIGSARAFHSGLLPPDYAPERPLPAPSAAPPPDRPRTTRSTVVNPTDKGARVPYSGASCEKELRSPDRQTCNSLVVTKSPQPRLRTALFTAPPLSTQPPSKASSSTPARESASTAIPGCRRPIPSGCSCPSFERPLPIRAR